MLTKFQNYLVCWMDNPVRTFNSTVSILTYTDYEPKSIIHGYSSPTPPLPFPSFVHNFIFYRFNFLNNEFERSTLCSSQVIFCNATKSDNFKQLTSARAIILYREYRSYWMLVHIVTVMTEWHRHRYQHQIQIF